jgi:hypothetical protein
MGLKLDEKPIAMFARAGAPDECGQGPRQRGYARGAVGPAPDVGRGDVPARTARSATVERFRSTLR